MNNNVAVKYIHKKTDTLSLSLLYKLNVSVFLWRFVYISMSAGNYFYSYIIIPATTNHNSVFTITHD